MQGRVPRTGALRQKEGREKRGDEERKIWKVYSSPSGITRRVLRRNSGSECVTRAHILRGAKTPSDTISHLPKNR